jgi:hypothetical protein
MQQALAFEVLWPIHVYNSIIQCCLHAVLSSHLHNFWRDSTVINRYVSFFTSFFVELIVLPAVLVQCGVAAHQETLPKPIPFHNLRPVTR